MVCKIYLVDLEKSISKKKRKMITIYGIKNCDSCKKAVKHFGDRAEFRDIRKFQLSKETLKKFFQHFGEQLLNTRSKTWKTLTPSEKSLDTLQLLNRCPTVMKRPVIECSESEKKTIGWSEEIREQYL